MLSSEPVPSGRQEVGASAVVAAETAGGTVTLDCASCPDGLRVSRELHLIREDYTCSGLLVRFVLT